MLSVKTRIKFYQQMQKNLSNESKREYQTKILNSQLENTRKINSEYGTVDVHNCNTTSDTGCHTSWSLVQGSSGKG